MTSGERTISILFVCGSTMACELYTQALNGRKGFQVVACAASVEEAVQAVKSNEIDVALLTMALVDGPSSGLTALQQIHKARPGVKPVIFLDDSEPQVVVTAFQAGAKGVFSPGND